MESEDDGKFSRTWRLLKRFYELFWLEDVLSRSAQVAFYLSFSLFPLLLFLVNVAGLVLGRADDLRLELYSYLKEIMPSSAYVLVRNTIAEVTENSSSSKLTVGFLIALWSASAGMDSLRVALNHVSRIKESRPWWKTKSESLGLTLLLIVMMSFVLGTVFYGWKFVALLLALVNLPIESLVILQLTQWLTFLLVLFFSFGVIYRYLPDQYASRCGWLSPGSLTAIALWMLATNGFRLYLNFFNNYDKTYGSLGAVMILMLWLYLTALAILIGGLLNKVIDEFAIAEKEAQKIDEVSKTDT